MTKYKTRMIECGHDYVGTSKQPVRLFCNHCGMPKQLADYIAELEEWIEFVRMNSKDAAHMADAALRESE